MCKKCMCLAQGGVGGEWIRGFGLGFTNPVLSGYLRILGAPSVQSCCILSISASYRAFVYGRYRKYRLVCVLLSDLELSRYHPHCRPAQKAVNRDPISGGGRFRHNLNSCLQKPL